MLLAARLVRGITALLVLFVLVVGGGGWYFAGRIHADGLRVAPDVVERDLRVVARGTDTLTLRGDSEELRTAGTYGLVWSGGFGQVTGTPVGGREVTRSFRVLTGRAPERDALVGITDDAFPDDPRVALGRPAQEVGIASPAGRFPAWYVPGSGRVWVVLVHGKGASRTEMLRMMRVPVRLGLPALDISYRNDAVLPRDESRQYRYGRTEWEDLAAAVGWAREQGARHVVLVGASMGASVVAEMLERSPYRSLVRGLVLDSPLLSFDHAVDLAASRQDLPVLGGVPGPVTWAAKRFASLRYGVDWDALDHLDDTSWLRVPTLLVHGTGDTRVPFGDSERLAEDQPSLVLLSRDDGVQHLESWNHDPFGYEDELRRFLGTVR